MAVPTRALLTRSQARPSASAWASAAARSACYIPTWHGAVMHVCSNTGSMAARRLWKAVERTWVMQLRQHDTAKRIAQQSGLGALPNFIDLCKPEG